MKKLIAMLLALTLCLCGLSVAVFSAPEGLHRLAVVGMGLPGLKDWDINDPAGDMTEVSNNVYTKTLELTAGTEMRFKIATDNGNGGWNDAFNFGGAELTLSTEAQLENAGTSRDMYFKADKDMELKITVDLNPLLEGGKATIRIDNDSEPQPTEPTEPTQPSEPPQPEEETTGKKYTLTVEAPERWQTVYVYTWEPETLGTYPGTEMQKIADNTYEYRIDQSGTRLVLSDGAYAKTPDIRISTDKDVSIRINDDNSFTILYPSTGRIPRPEKIELELSEYRVVGNADWLGNWDPAFEGGRMYNMGDGLYRINFKDVPIGDYEFKITKDGKWDNAYGIDGRNVTFSVIQKCKVTVDFDLTDGVIEVYGPAGWWDDEEENPESADLSLGLPIAVMLTGAVALPLLLRKKNAFL